jgi:hypothetical protein
MSNETRGSHGKKAFIGKVSARDWKFAAFVNFANKRFAILKRWRALELSPE